MRARDRNQIAALAIAVITSVVLLTSGSARADVTKVAGGAFGYDLSGLINWGPSPVVALPATGGGPFTDSTAEINIPAVLSTGAMTVSTQGGNLGTHQGFAKSSATASNVSIASGVVTANLVAAQCQSTGDGSLGTSSFVNLRVAGLRVETFAPNTTINVPGVARVVINERKLANSSGSTSITVNALRVKLLAAVPLLETEIVLAQARCKATGWDVNGGTTTTTTTTTSHPYGCPCTLWDNATVPSIVDPGDPGALELGVKFRADVNGVVTGIRFYKSAANTGTHVGNLWTGAGTLLGSVTFTGETASGWQTATFAAPIAVTADTTYVASYYAPAGHYSFDAGYFFASSWYRPPLLGLQEEYEGPNTPNGVFQYGPTSAFPTRGNGGANYWVDLVFR